jgi:hypothetical protein
VVSLAQTTYAQPIRSQRSYAHAQVEVQKRLDGSLAVCYQCQLVQTREAPQEAPLLRARPERRSQPSASQPGNEQAGRSGERQDRP